MLFRSAGPDYRPFFAVLSVQPPHGPNVPPTNPPYGFPRIHPADIELRRNVPVNPRLEQRARLNLAGYYAMIENLDYNIGRIRAALTDMAVDRDTYVVFFSDHGDMMGSHGQFGKSAPWEEAIRVPFIVHRAGGAYNMRVGSSDAPLNHVDIAPTSLGLCGIAKPEARPATTTQRTASASTLPSTAARRGPTASRRARTCSRSRPSCTHTP